MRKVKPSSWIFLVGMLSFGAALLGATGVLVPGLAPAYSEQPAASTAAWAAAAPGRVEPKGRALRIVSPSPAIIREVWAALNDRVQKGDLLVRLDDEELLARLAAAKAQVAVKTTDRDNVKASGNALDRRKAEDNLYNAERTAVDARLDLDRLIAEFKTNKAKLSDVQSGRSAVTAANEKLQQDQQKLKKALAKNLPALTREEAALAAARAEVSALSASLERMRIRSPIDATVLEFNAKIGETASLASESPLLALGDITSLQVRAEVEERDVSKIYAGQPAVAKSDAFPNRMFDVRVSVIAKSLGAPQLSARNRRKQTDVEVLEVVLDLEEGVPLLPGMRVDVLFREGEVKSSSASAK